MGAYRPGDAHVQFGEAGLRHVCRALGVLAPSPSSERPSAPSPSPSSRRAPELSRPSPAPQPQVAWHTDTAGRRVILGPSGPLVTQHSGTFCLFASSSSSTARDPRFSDTPVISVISIFKVTRKHLREPGAWERGRRSRRKARERACGSRRGRAAAARAPRKSRLRGELRIGSAVGSARPGRSRGLADRRALTPAAHAGKSHPRGGTGHPRPRPAEATPTSRSSVPGAAHFWTFLLSRL